MEIEFLNHKGDFKLEYADGSTGLYFPLTNDLGIMNSISPRLDGDSKLDQNTFLLEPISIEHFQQADTARNVWFRINSSVLWPVNGCSGCKEEEAERVTVTAGKLWHKVVRQHGTLAISCEILNFIPLGKYSEIMEVTLTNHSLDPIEIEPMVSIPIYGRSADNIRDHRHVTSLLHHIEVVEDGIEVTPTLSFDERGHQLNHTTYGVYACGEQGEKPIAFYPVKSEYIGEGGTTISPHTVTRGIKIPYKPGAVHDGYEAMGAIEFARKRVESNQKVTYTIILSYNRSGIELLGKELTNELEQSTQYWEEQSSIRTITGDSKFDLWLGWVGLQPTLRRIFGCSFLPHHDYGRGGRGYRDLWQDCLALLLLSPESIREQLINYYGGVRIDGSNATIIGKKQGEFIADRNAIVRMWMDHGVWPCITTLLYCNQTGDLEILLEEVPYFKDAITCRGRQKDALWDEEEPVMKTYSNRVYYGTVLEHLLIQHLTAFFDVGSHGHMKLRDADWNDALDMAKDKGESVAFTAAYAGNLERLAEVLLVLQEKLGISQICLATELLPLITINQEVYSSITERNRILDNYCQACSSYISGEKKHISIGMVYEGLLEKAKYLKDNIREKELVTDGMGHTWFNSYYDNHGRQVEGKHQDNIRMMLTGQVFTIMSNTASDEQVEQIVKAVETYLTDPLVGGVRLNTNFHEIKTDLGRMFGFAYGTKENGSVFSHMAVMYAYSLYSRGFVKEGYRVLMQLYKQAMNFEVSRIYPGIPEYFDAKGRGMYHYLTGAASWYMLTTLTEMFGVKGYYGDLQIEPKLLLEQFDEMGQASVHFYFAERLIKVTYHNGYRKEFGDYEVMDIRIDGSCYINEGNHQRIGKERILSLDKEKIHYIEIRLG